MVCLSKSLYPFLVILIIAVAANQLVAEPLQQDVPYFVDAAGTEYDLEKEAKIFESMRGLSREEQLHATMMAAARRLQRWRVYLKSDGTWSPDPFFGKQDYADQHYPVEYVLPAGYRGAFQVVWGVPGAPPLSLVNDKLQVYIPASGVYETSSDLALTTGAVASPEHQFYFEDNGKRTVIPHEPLQPGQIGINNGTTACRGMPEKCMTYFVGSREEWQAAQSAICPTPDAQVQVITSGRECSDVPPGSTQPVAEIAAPWGRSTLMATEFHGRTLNGRRVVLSMSPSGVTSWRFDSPELNVPEEPALAEELKTYVKAILATNAGTNLDRAGCSPEEMRSVLRASITGPYLLFRTPYSSEVLGEFVSAEEPNDKAAHTMLSFARGEQGWKLVGANCHVNWRQYETVSRLNTKTSEFIGKAVLQGSTTVVLRRDGTWDSDDPSELELPAYGDKSFIGYDMNGAKLELAMDDRHRGTWRRLNDPPLHIQTETVVSELNHALDRYTVLLSAGNVAEFVAEGGTQTEAYRIYRELDEFGDESKQANDVYDFLKQTGDGERIVRQYGDDHFKAAIKKELLESAIHGVEIVPTLQELKRLRKEKPRIARVPFSPNFEALYTLPEGSSHSQTIRRVTGHGSTWALLPE